MNPPCQVHYPDGARAKANAGAPSCLIAYGSSDAEVLRTCGLPGAFYGPALMVDKVEYDGY